MTDQVDSAERVEGEFDIAEPPAKVWRAISPIPGLEPPFIPDYARPNYQSYAVRVTPDYPLGRDQLMQALLDRGVSSRRGIMNAHQEGAYRGAGNKALPHSERSRDSVILLPLYGALTDADQDRVIGYLRGIGATEARVPS